MQDDPEREKLNQLSARIKKAEGEDKRETPQMAADRSALFRAGRIGFDFVATVTICVVIGWLADRGMGSKPWGLLVMLLIGFVAGIANIWRALGNYDQSVGWKKRDGK